MTSIQGLKVYRSKDVLDPMSDESESWNHWRWRCPECGKHAHTQKLYFDPEWIKAKCDSCDYAFAVKE